MNNNFDSEYEIQQSILTKLGGDGTKCFDSQYSILLEILDKIEGGIGAQIDDSSISAETTWSSSKIVSELADAGFDIEIVSELPTTGDPHTIYFVPSSNPETSNVKDEFMYINGAWEQVGSTAVDLSNYYTKAECASTFNPINTVTANADSKKLPYWNEYGQITGSAISVYNDNLTINGNHINILSTQNQGFGSIYAPVDAGTAGQYLVADGSGAPTWQTTSFAKLSVLTQAQYDALATKDASTLYVISDAQ